MNRWVVVAVATLLTNVCMAQTKLTTRKEPPVKFSMSMIEGNRIDLKYTGLPVADVIDAVEKLPGEKKGEFESTADFNARKAVALAGKFLGNSSVEDTFAFVVPVTKGRANAGDITSRGIKYDYNADTSELRLFVLPESSSMNGISAPDFQTSRRESKGLDQFDLDLKINSTTTYKASNAFGATVTVEKTVSTRLGIAVNRIPFLIYGPANQTYLVQLHMENFKAAKELPSLKALIVMKLADPYVVYDLRHSQPTRDNPTERITQRKYLTGDVFAIVVYSGLTGDVLARFR